MKLSPENLNSIPYSPHPTSINTYGVTIALRVHSGNSSFICETINLNEIKFYKDVV